MSASRVFVRSSERTGAGDLIAVAVAVVELAQREAALGDRAAAAWLDQVRRDILEDAPPHIAGRLSANAEPLPAARPWPSWAEPLLAAIAGGASVSAAARAAGISGSTVYDLALRRPDFTQALAEARQAGAA